MTLREAHPFQLAGVDFLAARSRAALTDDPGLGKSMQAIRAAKRVGARTILIVCPAIGRISWLKEIALEDPAAEVRVLDSLVPSDRFAFVDHSYVIVSWDTLSRADNDGLRRALRSVGFHVAVLDEAHYAKNPAANRTRAVYGKGMQFEKGMLAGIPYVWLLSGTLAPNHAGEVYPHVRALFPEVLVAAGIPGDSPLQLWENKFCDVSNGTYGRRVVGSRNLSRLRELLTPHMLRRRKSEVLTELPPLQMVDEYLDPDCLTPGERAATAEWTLPPGITGDAFIAWLNDQSVAMSSRRRQLGVAKAHAASLWARNLLDSGCRKLLLFAWHTEVIDRLAHLLGDYGPVVLDGRTSTAHRQIAVDSFQTDPLYRVFIGQLQAAGTAITLTAASDVGIVECSWVPSDNFQAICRAHRMGQRDGVLARFLAVPDTIDEHIMDTFRRKAEEMAELFD